jgi:hypothetical protein
MAAKFLYCTIKEMCTNSQNHKCIQITLSFVAVVCIFPSFLSNRDFVVFFTRCLDRMFTFNIQPNDDLKIRVMI